MGNDVAVQRPAAACQLLVLADRLRHRVLRVDEVDVHLENPRLLWSTAMRWTRPAATTRQPDMFSGTRKLPLVCGGHACAIGHSVAAESTYWDTGLLRSDRLPG